MQIARVFSTRYRIAERCKDCYYRKKTRLEDYHAKPKWMDMATRFRLATLVATAQTGLAL